MMRVLKFLLSSQLKRPQRSEQSSGFTLIEMLVALLIAFLVITPLMGFMISVMNTDRQEQAKSNTEQEMQAALDYIARDLQQAIYIYDSAGINAIRNQLPNSTSTDRVPVLVFWKRELISQAITVTASDKDDTYVYSLVAYYLIKDTNTTWSNAARIARWQIRDGVASASASAVTCDGYTGKYVNGYCPSSGYAPFNLEGTGTIEEKMNKWTRLSQYTTKVNGIDVVTTVTPGSPIVLVDYIDSTLSTNNPAPPTQGTCPTDFTYVSPDTTNFNTRDTFKMKSFSACVNKTTTTAQVFLRGNAIARLQRNNLNYITSRGIYYPTASIRVQGRGYLFTQ